MACIKRTKYGYRADWRDKQGNRYRKTFDLKKDAEDFLSTVKVDIKNGTFLTAKTAPLFREVAEEWLKSKCDKRPSTLAQYRMHLDSYLLPAFGDARFSDLDVRMVTTQRNRWFEEQNSRCSGGHLAPQTVNKLLTTLSMIFEFARKRKQCVGNVAADADRLLRNNGELTAATGPERRDPDEVAEDEVLSPDEVRRLLEHAEPGYYRTLFLMAAFTGGRHGELLALQWPDIDFEGGTVHFRRSLSWARLPGEEVRPRFFRPKTKAGVRKVPLAPELVHELKVWKLQCPPSTDDLVFPIADGTPMRRHIVLRSGLYPALKRAKLRRVDMHSLRHSFASGLIAQGASVTEVQAYLGHASPTITLKTYSHWFNGVKTDSIARLARTALSGKWTPSGHLTAAEAGQKAVSD